jgi:hypothetical protein
MNVKNLIIGIIIIASIATVGCKRKGCTDSTASNYDSKAKKDDGSCDYNLMGNYDRAIMLTNIAENYIIPAYSNYELTLTNLKSKVSLFNASPSTSTLQELRLSWKQACIDWQSVAFIDFGPAKDLSLKAQTNIFPVDTSLINSNISTGTYDLQIPINFDAKGLQAIDYLLFGTGTNEQAVIDYFINHQAAKDYLSAVSDELKSNASTVLSNWNSSYSEAFKNNNADNSQGSSVSNLVNALSSHFETYVRKGKIGLPAGVFNGFSQQAMPGHVEGLYSEYSFEFAKATMQAMKKYIKGNDFSTNETGQGLDDYINFVSAKDANGNALEITIESQITTIITALNSHSNPLSFEVVNNSSKVLATYQEMQKLVPLIKVDLTSALGVLVTYQDNDGD